MTKKQAVSEERASLKEINVRLHRMQSNQNVTSLATCKRLQPVTIVASGCLTSLKTKLGMNGWPILSK